MKLLLLIRTLDTCIAAAMSHSFNDWSNKLALSTHHYSIHTSLDLQTPLNTHTSPICAALSRCAEVNSGHPLIKAMTCLTGQNNQLGGSWYPVFKASSYKQYDNLSVRAWKPVLTKRSVRLILSSVSYTSRQPFQKPLNIKFSSEVLSVLVKICLSCLPHPQYSSHQNLDS